MSKLNVITAAIFLLLAFTFSIISMFALPNEYLLGSAIIVLGITISLMFVCNVVRITSTLFIPTVFIFIQFVAIILPLLFGELPTYEYFPSQDVAIIYFKKYLFILLIGYSLLLFGYIFGRKYLIYDGPIVTSTIKDKFVYVPFFLSLVCFIVIFYRAGGVFNTLQGGLARFEALEASNFFVAFTKFGYLTSVLLLIRNKNMFCIITFIFITACMGLIGERGSVLFFGVIPLLVTLSMVGRSLSLKNIIILLVAFCVYYGSIGALRNNVDENEEFDLKTSSLSIIKHTAHHHIAASTIFMADNDGFWYGKSLANIIFAPIPRSIWPTKPIIAESGAVGAQLKGSDMLSGIGLPPGNFAYYYLQGGIVGLIVLSIVSGFFSGCIESFFLKTNNEFNILLYSQTQTLFFFIFSTEVQMKLLTTFIPLLLIYLVFSKGKIK